MNASAHSSHGRSLLPHPLCRIRSQTWGDSPSALMRDRSAVNRRERPVSQVLFQKSGRGKFSVKDMKITVPKLCPPSTSFPILGESGGM